jgi:ABC-2 type transport system permease protein
MSTPAPRLDDGLSGQSLGLTPDVTRAPRQRSRAALVAHQFRYELPTFWRNPQSVFFTLAFPVMFLVIFASVFGHHDVSAPGGRISESVYYVPGIMALGIISASFGNLATSVIGNREAGIYKRRRATPVPAVVLIAARALVAVTLALLIAAVLLAIGYGYGASIPSHTAPALILDIVVASLAFCCLGYALASVVANADAITPIVTFITLPLYFISGVFVPASQLPHWLVNIASVFPIRHLASALLAAYNPHTAGTGIHGVDLAVIAGWGLFGLIVAVWRFSWLPKR